MTEYYGSTHSAFDIPLLKEYNSMDAEEKQVTSIQHPLPPAQSSVQRVINSGSNAIISSVANAKLQSASAAATAQSTTTAKKAIEKQTRSRKAISAFRKKKERERDYVGRLGVHVDFDEYCLKELESVLADDYLTADGWEYVNHYDVIRIWQRPSLSEEQMWDGFATDDSIPGDETTEALLHMMVDAASPELYIFSFGAVVFWNFPDEQAERQWLTQRLFVLDRVCGTRHDPQAVESACDDIEFVYGDSFAIRRDVCHLMTREPGERLAVSFAIAKSSLLSIYEWILQQTIERNSDVPEQLAKHGTIKMNKVSISKEIGKIFLVKHTVNLDSNLQDTPEEFWDDDRYEQTYVKTCEYFELSKRMNLVNNRLKMLEDLHKVLIEEVQTKHNILLEWVVIWLIALEVVFELYHAFKTT